MKHLANVEIFDKFSAHNFYYRHVSTFFSEISTFLIFFFAPLIAVVVFVKLLVRCFTDFFCTTLNFLDPN